jgi:hypothetical protein
MRGKFPFLQKIWSIGARHAEDISPDGSNGKQADHTYRNAAQQAGRPVPLTAEEIHRVATYAARRISDSDGDRTGDHAAEEVSAGTRGRGRGVGSNAKAAMFFQRLCGKRYGIPAELISYLTFPHEGTTYTDLDAPEAESPNIPAVFTFVGQFVDHDLTFNGANLFDDQTGASVPDFASPLIDLDSVYGGRSYPDDPADTSTKDIIRNSDVFNGDMAFKLWRLGPNAYDVTRWTDASLQDRVGAAYIFDPRNDENQLILQVHILLMHVHNKLLKIAYEQDKTLNPKHKKDAEKAAEKVKAEVIANWQSVLLNDFLPRVCEPGSLAWVLKEIALSGHGAMKYKPAGDGSLQMPHEFAIGFRFGHSMLRNEYMLNSAGAVQLFNNRDLERKGDLRGGRPLTRDHVIDWDVFYPKMNLTRSCL